MKKIYLLTATILLFYTVQAQFTAIPDSNFEQALIDLGHDDVLDGQVLTANIVGVAELYIPNYDIQDLTGIQAFVALIELRVYENLLTSLDISQNLALEFLDISINPISSIDISNNLNLGVFSADSTNLNALDTLNNSNLLFISLNNSNISSLDLINNIKLVGLYVNGNNLSHLDVGNLYLWFLYCSDNPNLSFINIKSGNTDTLEQFLALGIEKNACIQVHDPVAAAEGTTYPYYYWAVDPTAIFSENCALSVNTFADEKFLFFPNPTTDKVKFVNTTIASFEIYDSKGSVVLKNTNLNDNSIEVANLSPGIYFIKVYDDKNQTQNIRFVKK